MLPNAPLVTDRAWIEKHDIHLVVHGDDYAREELEYYCKVPMEMGLFRTVSYTRGISTSEIIRRVLARQSRDRILHPGVSRPDAGCQADAIVGPTCSLRGAG